MSEGDKEWENFLSKDEALFERDEEGKLLPIDVELTTLRKKKDKKIIKEGPKVRIIPIERGKWLRLLKLSDIEQDKIIITEHLLVPKITEEEYESKARTPIVSAIITEVVKQTLDISYLDKEDKRDDVTGVEEASIKNSLPEKAGN